MTTELSRDDYKQLMDKDFKDGFMQLAIDAPYLLTVELMKYAIGKGIEPSSYFPSTELSPEVIMAGIKHDPALIDSLFHEQKTEDVVYEAIVNGSQLGAADDLQGDLVNPRFINRLISEDRNLLNFFTTKIRFFTPERFDINNLIDLYHTMLTSVDDLENCRQMGGADMSRIIERMVEIVPNLTELDETLVDKIDQINEVIMQFTPNQTFNLLWLPMKEAYLEPKDVTLRKEVCAFFDSGFSLEDIQAAVRDEYTRRENAQSKPESKHYRSGQMQSI